MPTMTLAIGSACHTCGWDVLPGTRYCRNHQPAPEPVPEPVAPAPAPPPPEPEIIIQCVTCADPDCDETCDQTPAPPPEPEPAPEPVAPPRGSNRSGIDAMLNLAELRTKRKPRINTDDLSRALALAKIHADEFTQADCDRFNRLAAELPGLIREILYLQPQQDDRLDLRLADRVDKGRRRKVK